MSSFTDDHTKNSKPPPSSSSKSNSNSNSNSWGKNNDLINKIAFFFILGALISFLFLYHSAYPFQSFIPSSSSSSSIPQSNLTIFKGYNETELKNILKSAAMEDKTVILTTLNEAWAEPNSIFDVFLKSFKIGNDTNRLLKHLVIISLDEKAHVRCLEIHPHCYALKSKQAENFSSEAYFMTPTYLEMMWTRIDFLSIVLQLGYNFVFTDADIVWLRDPFPNFYNHVDFQIACDNYIGNPTSRHNQPNGGFNFVKSNKRSIKFYKYWYSSRLRFPGKHDQDVLNKIKFDPFINKIGLRMRFLDTKYFGGFCEPSRDFNLVCTMHANCCFGLDNKVHDLRIVLEDWRRFMLSPPNTKALGTFSWRAPDKCSLKSFHPPSKDKH
ncbi:Nucleotide-diphospho-sugar transferase family protein [Euphorbia peplus]|nr:Nucleotide-diphospho-sugar transferase family protein [Euphorbia peplus]